MRIWEEASRQKMALRMFLLARAGAKPRKEEVDELSEIPPELHKLAASG
jgi:hypothetical protein